MELLMDWVWIAWTFVIFTACGVLIAALEVAAYHDWRCLWVIPLTPVVPTLGNIGRELWRVKHE
jgi:hypothetical protein